MARPFTSRPTVRVQTQGPQQMPGLGVHAPLNVRTPGPETSPLGGLLQSLGIFGTVLAQGKKERDDFDFAAGKADEQIGRADLARAEKSRAYADGAYQVAVVEQYHAAEQKVAERAASEDLDKSLPVEDQIRVIDGWMKSELGPLVADDRAKVLIGERYQQFIDTFSANVVKDQAEARAKAAEDAVLQDTTAQLDKTGTFNYDEQFHRLYSQTGDAVAANSLLVGVVAQRIEDAANRGEPYEQFRALIPTESIGPRGQKIPGPMYNPKYRGIINQAMANAERLHDHFYETKYSTANYHALVDLDSQIRAGMPVTEDSIAAAGYTIGDVSKGATLSWAQARQALDRSAAMQAAASAKKAEAQQAQALHDAYGRWGDVLHLGTLSPEKVADAADAQVQRVLLGSGYSATDLAGVGLASNPDLIRTIAGWSAAEGVPYRPLKDTLSSINQAAPGDMTGRLEAYSELKRRGLAGMYVSDEAAVIYEAALTAQEAHLSKEDTANYIRTMGDKTTAEYVSNGMRDVRVRERGFVLDTGSGYFSNLDHGKVNSAATVNPGYLAGKYEALTSFALSRGQSLKAAEAFALNRIQQTHAALKFSGVVGFLPREEIGGDPEVAQRALDWYQTQLPALRKAADVPPDEPVSIVPRVSINGRGTTLEVQRLGGSAIQRGTVSLKGLIQTYLRLHPQQSGQARAAAEQKARREKAAKFKAMPNLTDVAHELEAPKPLNPNPPSLLDVSE